MITRAFGLSRRARRAIQALGVGAVGNRAGIDHVHVGDLIEVATLESQTREPRLDHRGVVLIDLAAEGRDREAHYS